MRRKGREEKKNNGYTLSFYNSYFGDRSWPKKNRWTQKVYFAVNVIKNPATYILSYLKIVRSLK